MSRDPSGMQVLDADQCRELLTGEQIGRVVVSMDAMPAAFPVNYTVIGPEIYFRTAPGTKMSAAVNRTVVAFQVDAFDTDTSEGWSVLVVGPARLVTDAAERALLDAAGMYSWVASGHPHYVAIRMDRITGRRLLPAGEPSRVRLNR